MPPAATERFSQSMAIAAAPSLRFSHCFRRWLRLEES